MPLSAPIQARPDPAATNRPTLRSLLPAAALAMLGLAALAPLALAPTQATGQYVVIAAPLADRRSVADTIHRAGAGVMAFGRLPNVAIAWSTDAGFPALARAQGAWAVWPTSGGAGCATRAGGPAA